VAFLKYYEVVALTEGLSAGDTMQALDEKKLVAKILTTKLYVEQLRRQKRVLLEELYWYSLDAERPLKKRKVRSSKDSKGSKEDK
jgi:hypothetical protein